MNLDVIAEAGSVLKISIRISRPFLPIYLSAVPEAP